MELYAELVGRITLGILGALTLGFLLHKLREWARSKHWPPARLRNRLPTISLELSRSVEDVEAAVGNRGSEKRKRAVFWLAFDYVFIAVYWALFMAFAGLIAWRSDWELDSGWLWTGIATGLLATLTALADVRENVRTENVLGLTLRETTPVDVDRMRRASLAKWTAAVATTGLITALFWGDDRSGFVELLWWVYVGVTAIGVVGLVYYPLLALFFAVLGLAGLATLTYAAFWSSEFIRHLD